MDDARRQSDDQLYAGHTWQKLDVPGTAYYPRSVQTADGRIFIFGHVGGDDAYGKVDQSIVMDSFRLAAEAKETAAEPTVVFERCYSTSLPNGTSRR